MEGPYLLFTDFFLNAMSIQDLQNTYNMKLQLITKVSFIPISVYLIIPANTLITQSKTWTKSLFQNAMQWQL